MDPVTLATILKAGAPVVLAVVQLLRERGHESDAAELEAALARADQNFALVMERAAAAAAGGGLPPPVSDEGGG